MPTLPWTTIRTPAGEATEPAATDEALVMASLLQVSSWRHVPRFFWLSLAAWRQVRRAPGALGASLIAQLGSGTFWTLSAWENQKALYTYAKTEPHHTIMKRLRSTMSESYFVQWTVPAGELPISWDDARRRLDEERRRRS